MQEFLSFQTQCLLNHSMVWWTGVAHLHPKLETCAVDSNEKTEKLRAYHAYLDKMDEMFNPDPKQDDWTINKVLEHKVRHTTKGKEVLLKVQWENGEKSILPLETLRLHDPWICCSYAFQNNLTNKHGWDWVEHYLESDCVLHQMVQTYRVAKQDNGPKIKFGEIVPKSTKHAMELDRETGKQEWQKSMEIELDQLAEFETFRVIPDGEPTPKGYKRIPYHMVFDVKFDGWKKSRLVAGGHRTPDVPREDVFSPVVSMDTVRLGFILARLNDLEVCAGDIGNAYLNAKTREKVYIIAGPEFGPELAGKRLIIDKSLYGLKTSAARFHEHLSIKLRSLG